MQIKSDINERVNAALAKMTLEQKAAICSGMDAWRTVPFEEIGVPSITMSDGPHGLRLMVKNDVQLSIDSSVPATCFPTAVTMASSWDEGLLAEIGAAIGEECLAEDVQMLLGPGCNIKRTPLCGRNFEYYSEDPQLSTRCAAAFIDGVQSKGVGVSLKHFLANNQETNRFCVDVHVAERPLREIYLASFETAVKRSKPTTIMCSYPRLNGEHCSQNRRNLTGILRDEWDFDGVVVSDWGAVNERVDAIKAGLELEMPSSGGIGAGKLVKAVNDGTLSTDVLDTAVRRMLKLIFMLDDNKREGYAYDADAHHELARDALRRSAVLLRNDGGLLPLAKNAKIAVIGDMAQEPRIQGSGSSQVTPLRVSGIYECMTAAAPEAEITYSAGYVRNEDAPSEALIAEAVAAAKEAGVAVIVAGLTEHFEAEGFDRKHMRIPTGQRELIKAVAAAQPNTVVLLINGAPIELDFIENVPAVLELYLGGQAIGLAAADLLFGEVSPSGRLAETFPLYLENCPAEIGYDSVDYEEGVFVGYRYYDTRKYPVRFPFGYGLSYTTFAYDKLTVSADSIKDTDTLTVSVEVTNTGAVAGGEVVQLYVSKPQSGVKRPLRELRNYGKVYLAPGETKKVTMQLDKRSFAYYDEQAADWRAESGEYLIQICKNSREVILEKSVQVEDTLPRTESRLYVDRNTPLHDLFADKLCAPLINAIMRYAAEIGKIPDKLVEGDSFEMFDQSPLRSIFNMWTNNGNENALNAIIALFNDKTESDRLVADEKELRAFLKKLF